MAVVISVSGRHVQNFNARDFRKPLTSDPERLSPIPSLGFSSIIAACPRRAPSSSLLFAKKLARAGEEQARDWGLARPDSFSDASAWAISVLFPLLKLYSSCEKEAHHADTLGYKVLSRHTSSVMQVLREGTQFEQTIKHIGIRTVT